jgi:hypothetical protein
MMRASISIAMSSARRNTPSPTIIAASAPSRTGLRPTTSETLPDTSYRAEGGDGVDGEDERGGQGATVHCS